MTSGTRLLAMALPSSAPASLCATQGPPRATDKNLNMHAEIMPSDMCVAALAPPTHVCTNQRDIMLVGVTQLSSVFFCGCCTAFAET